MDNLVAPESVTQKTFTRELGRQLNRPAFLRVPALFLKIFLGKASVMILDNPGVIPQRLQEESFGFTYPTLKETLKEIIRK